MKIQHLFLQIENRFVHAKYKLFIEFFKIIISFLIFSAKLNKWTPFDVIMLNVISDLMYSYFHGTVQLRFIHKKLVNVIIRLILSQSDHIKRLPIHSETRFQLKIRPKKDSGFAFVANIEAVLTNCFRQKLLNSILFI